MLVSDYMTKDVFTANLRDGLRQTFLRMREKDIRHMPVLDEDSRLTGIISDRDLRRPTWADEGDNIAHPFVLDNNTLVEEAMTNDPEFVYPNDPVQRALELFLAHGFGALPVVDDNNKLIGMLSTMDMLRAFRDAIDE